MCGQLLPCHEVTTPQTVRSPRWSSGLSPLSSVPPLSLHSVGLHLQIVGLAFTDPRTARMPFAVPDSALVAAARDLPVGLAPNRRAIAAAKARLEPVSNGVLPTSVPARAVLAQSCKLEID